MITDTKIMFGETVTERFDGKNGSSVVTATGREADGRKIVSHVISTDSVVDAVRTLRSFFTPASEPLITANGVMFHRENASALIIITVVAR